MRFLAASLPLLIAGAIRPAESFVPSSSSSRWGTTTTSSVVPSIVATESSAETAASSAPPSLSDSVTELKRVLEREYVSFFDPMRREYYAPNVAFVDPMTTLEGVDSYQNNVDMLASRTLLGKLLFEDAGIVLHNIEGGDVVVGEGGEGGEISDIITRWTLRLTAKVLPWSPTARFSGISVYKVKPTPGSSVGVTIVGQTDYWDSVNISPESGGEYGPVDKSRAIGDFLGQLAPGGFEAAAAAPELPYSLLRRGDGYEVRKYPAFAGVKLPYNRRDEGFGSLGAFTKGESRVESGSRSDRSISDRRRRGPSADDGRRRVCRPNFTAQLIPF